MITTDQVTYYNALGLSFTLLMGVLILILPRRYALVPLFMLTCWMTMAVGTSCFATT